MTVHACASKPGVTWQQLTALEPRLAGLLTKARKVRDTGGGYFCANEIWYNHLKPELCRLVGWDRRQGPDELRTVQAYDLAYMKVYNALPNCRRCGCF